MGTKTLMTVEDFAAMDTAETEDYGLIEGELIPRSSGNPLHADIRGLLEQLLRNYFATHLTGRAFSELECRLSEGTVRRPDLSIFLAERLQSIDRRQIPIPFPPNIAVEVLSPSESAVDVHRKVLDYLAAGAQEVWLFDHDNAEIFVQTTTGIRLLRGEEALETPLLPGFSATVAQLLAGF